MFTLHLVVLGLNVIVCSCQTSTLVIDVVDVKTTDSPTFVCKVPSITNLTRWSYLAGPTGTSLMSYQNGTCTVSSSDSFLSDNNRYVYACNSTVQQVTILFTNEGINNHIFDCRDAVQPDTPGSTWMINIVQDGEQCNCNRTITFNIRDLTERENVTFICKVSSNVLYVNWNKKMGSNTAAMGVDQNGQCTTSSNGTTYLDDTSKYIYTCNNTVYQVTILHVSRREHNEMYMCTPSSQAEGTGSNWIVRVKAPVTSVTIAPSIYLVNVTENTPLELRCTTSTARPTASVYWYRHPDGNWQNFTQITDNITTTTDYNDLSITTSILRFVPTRQDNDIKIYCRANNSINTSPVSSEKKLLNVFYKADDPYILQGSEYRVIENTPGTLSCTVKGGNPTPTLSWICNNFLPTNQLTTNSNGNSTLSFTWAASRAHEETCTCTSTQTGFTSKTIDVSLVILYPPSKPTFRAGGINANGGIYFIEGNSRGINCTSDSNPSPDRYTWTGPRIVGSIDIQSVMLRNISRLDAGEYKCSVYNTMHPSTEELVAGINSSTVNVVVLYPPSALYFVYGNQSRHNISNNTIDVIKGGTFEIECISIDGNPLPTISWNGQKNDGHILSVDNIQESRSNATCTATNIMKETNKPVVQGFISETIIFNILVHATITSCEFYIKRGTTIVLYLNINKTVTLSIIENESFTLNCSSEGRPKPTVHWKIPELPLISSSSIIVNNLTRQMEGDYVFTANNLLQPSFTNIQNVTVKNIVSVHVLYPPVIHPINNISKLKDEQFNLTCNYTSGMPEITSIKWTRDIDNREWSSAILNIGFLKKNDSGIYTCTASNTMVQSGDNKSYIGQHNQSFHLDVQYKTVITDFTIDGFTSQVVTINESDPIRLICNANSNPTAVMTLRHESDILVTATSNSVVYNIAKASCLDAGTFYCSARNDHNELHHILELFVNCHPRAEQEEEMFIKSTKNERTHITFKAIAYPLPTFTWFRRVDDNWMILENEDNFVIQSKDLQSTLIIVNVGTNDFTSYKVMAENKLGQFEQIYVLYRYGVPDTPTELKQIQSQTTTSTIHIEWKPGFNGGPTQTFYIKYKKSSATTWVYFTVDDIEEKTMDISLTGLAENTQYDIVIFSSNTIGNSSETPVLIALTKGISNIHTNLGPLVGSIVGGVIGCVILVVIIIVIIRRCTFCKVCGKTVSNEKSDKTKSSPEEQAYYNTGRLEDITNENNDATAYDEIGSVTNTDKSAEDSITNNVASDNNYEMVNLNTGESTPYSLLDQTEERITSDTANEDNQAEYEEMKIQVF